MTDNRTSKPTPEQVEAAAKEYAWNGSMRAALVAAQGAAPQAKSEQPWNDPSDPNSPQFDSPWEKAAALIQSIRCTQWDMLERRDQEDVRDEINGLIDRLDELATTMLAAPVLPSSGVDVAKIESLIMGRTATAGSRAVAEWLKGQGRGSEM